jgi:hypothetical protein
MKRPAPFDVLTATRPIGVSPMPAQAFLPELFPMPVSLHALHDETIGLLSEGNSNATSPFCALTLRPERPIRVGPGRRVALAEMALHPCHPKFDGELPLRVKGGCRRQVDGAAGLRSAPEMPCAPRQLRLVP